MEMTYAQYLRIDTLAGGDAASNIQFIRAAHSRLSEKGKSREYRECRHQWLRDGLRYKGRTV